MKSLAAVCCCILIGVGAANAQPPPNYAPIPPLRQEVIPRAPNGRAVWEPGHWDWNGRRYVWLGGHYVDRRAQHGRYAEGNWVWSDRQARWVWRRARWE
jgi:hypothetical protein